MRWLMLCLLSAARVRADASAILTNLTNYPVQTAREAYDALTSSEESGIALVFTGAVDWCGACRRWTGTDTCTTLQI